MSLPYSWPLLPDAALISPSLIYFTICHCLWSTFVIYLSLWVIQLLCYTRRDSDSVCCGGVAQTLLYRRPGHWYPPVLMAIPGSGAIHHKHSTERCLENSDTEISKGDGSREINYSPKLLWFPASDTEASRHRIALLTAYCEGYSGLLGLFCWGTLSVLREIIHFIGPYEKAGKSSYIFQNTGPAWGHLMFWSFEHHHSWLSLGTASFQRH